MSLPWIDVTRKEKFWIIDFSFYIYNGSFAYSRKCGCKGTDKKCDKCGGEGYIHSLKSKEGIPTGGLYTILCQIIERAKQGYKIITVFDPPKDQLDRMKLLDTYKGGRPPVPEFITYQMDYGVRMFPYTNVQCYYSDHNESDDVMASLAIKLADQGHEVVVSSDDKDMFPLLKHKNIRMFRQRKFFTVKEFGEKFNFPAGRFSDYLAICGDSADNFNLLGGLGPKAAEWIIQNTKDSCMEIFDKDKFGSVPMKYQKKLVNCNKPVSDKPIACPKVKTCKECDYFEGLKIEDMQLGLDIANLEYESDYISVNKKVDHNVVMSMLEELNLNHAINNIKYLL
jgi:protein Xni